VNAFGFPAAQVELSTGVPSGQWNCPGGLSMSDADSHKALARFFFVFWSNVTIFVMFINCIHAAAMRSSYPLLAPDLPALAEAYRDDYTPLVHQTTATGRNNYSLLVSVNLFTCVKKYQLTVALFM
jgi:hypothetical protein